MLLDLKSSVYIWIAYNPLFQLHQKFNHTTEGRNIIALSGNYWQDNIIEISLPLPEKL